MRFVRLLPVVLAGLLAIPSPAPAQQARPPLPEDVASVLGPGFTYDTERSRQDLEGARMSLRALLPAWMLEDDGLTVRAYRFAGGGLEEARAALRLTDAFPSSGSAVQRLPAGAGLTMMLSLLEGTARETYGDEWVARARERIPQLNEVEQASFHITADEEPEVDGDGLVRGRMVSLSGTSPYLELPSLELVQGTWLHLVEVKFAVPESKMRELMAELEDDEDAAGEEEWEEEDWDEEREAPGEEEIGAALYPGLEFFDTSGLMSAPRGATFTVRDRVDEIVDFYRTAGGLHCEIQDEYRPTAEDRVGGYGASVTLFCLDHPGEPAHEDEGVEILIHEPDAALVEEVEDMTDLWVPEGTVWVSFFRWDREL